jgi:hypothetical protein
MHDGSLHGLGGFLPEQSQRERPLYSIFSSRLYPAKNICCQQIPSGGAGLNIWDITLPVFSVWILIRVQALQGL